MANTSNDISNEPDVETKEILNTKPYSRKEAFITSLIEFGLVMLIIFVLIGSVSYFLLPKVFESSTQQQLQPVTSNNLDTVDDQLIVKKDGAVYNIDPKSKALLSDLENDKTQTVYCDYRRGYVTECQTEKPST